MTEDDTPVDQDADTGKHLHDPRQDAGQDTSIAARLERDPANTEAKLDRGLDESMDASDPPSTSQPKSNDAPPTSSGYDEEAERKLQQEKSA